MPLGANSPGASNIPRFRSDMTLSTPTMATLLAAGLIFLLALVLGIWKYRQMATSPDHLAHPYVDIAHRSALLYSFATLLVAVFVELSAWPAWVNAAAAATIILFFVGAIGSYILHGAKRDTTNQLSQPGRSIHVAMWALIIAEIGGFVVLLAGFLRGWL
jgi:hypothetical protein